MQRRNFLFSLGVLPFVLSKISSTEPSVNNKNTILVGLGNSGEILVKEFFRLEYQGKFRIIKTTKWDTTTMDDTTYKLLNEERFIIKPHPAFSRLAKKKNTHCVFIAGIGGEKSTYLTAYAHQEMEREGASFQMFLTTPFEFEGFKRNKRAKELQDAMHRDKRVKFLSLEDELRNPSWTMMETMEVHVPERLYELYQQYKA